MLNWKLLMIAIFTAVLIGTTPSTDAEERWDRYELETCVRDCFNTFDPVLNTPELRGCVEDCVGQYGPKREF